MNPYKFILVDIDTQHDFLSPQGSLYVPNAVEITPNLKRLIQWAQENRVPVISTVDSHVPDDPEFCEFPPHCVVGTPGHQKIPETILPSHRVSTPEESWQDLDFENLFDRYSQLIFQKRTYDIFDNPNIEKALDRIPADHFVVCGVATDYCIKAAVYKLLDLRKDVRLVVDAIAEIDPEQGKNFLHDFKKRGVTLIQTDNVILESF